MAKKQSKDATAPPKPLKAYQVDADESSVVIFATNGATARRRGANQLNEEFETVERCYRAPHFDRYAPGPVPALVKIAHGWWYTCTGCDITVREDLYEPGGKMHRFKPVDDPCSDGLFCSEQCKRAYDADNARKKRLGKAGTDWLEAWARRRHPTVPLTVTGTHSYVPTDKHGFPRFEQLVVHFTFPGATCGGGSARCDRKYGAERMGPPEMWVSAGDMATFDKLRGVKTDAA